MTIEFRDLHKLARERTRDAAGTVLQLLDENEEKTAMLLACAIDFVDGAAEVIKDTAKDANEVISTDQARAMALAMLMASFGPRVVLSAFKKLKEANQ